jgi:hypothetical protein
MPLYSFMEFFPTVEVVGSQPVTNRNTPVTGRNWLPVINALIGFSIYLGGFFTDVDAGSYGLEDCAQQLFDALAEPSKPGETPPLKRDTILFICHSTGGIVVRYMIESRVEAFAQKTIGLALMASPSYGAHLANTLSGLSRLYRQKLGRQLEWGSWGLEDLDRRFKLLIATRRVPHLIGAEAYENRFVLHRKWLPRFLDSVVEKESAARYFAPARQLPGTDHFTIVKPQGPNHPAHLFPCAFLRDLEEQERLWGISSNNRVSVASEPLRHYLYVSADKVTSLHEQIPSTKDQAGISGSAQESDNLSERQAFSKQGFVASLRG